jgi:hypothetical protein
MTRCDVDACSWIVRWKDLVRRRRFDHIFPSGPLKTISCEYLTAYVNRSAVTKMARAPRAFSPYAATTLIRPTVRDRGFRWSTKQAAVVADA